MTNQTCQGCSSRCSYEMSWDKLDTSQKIPNQTTPASQWWGIRGTVGATFPSTWTILELSCELRSWNQPFHELQGTVLSGTGFLGIARTTGLTAKQLWGWGFQVLRFQIHSFVMRESWGSWQTWLWIRNLFLCTAEILHWKLDNLEAN